MEQNTPEEGNLGGAGNAGEVTLDSLLAGNLSHLPASPYRTTSGAIIE